MTGKQARHSWAFRARFRRSAFGWRSSRLAIERIGEALAEIRQVQRYDPLLAAEGAVLLLEKLSPAICEVDSSSGALGNATHSAAHTLADLIAAAPASPSERQGWLERLYEALELDDPPYLEALGQRWGDLCATAAIASDWADMLLPVLERVVEERRAGRFAYARGTSACYSALLKAGRHDELLALVERDPRPIWRDRQWGAEVLLARGDVDGAIDYLKKADERYASPGALARFAERALLGAGRRDEAYRHYALTANQATTHLSTYRALARKYPEVDSGRLLSDLIASTPGQEGKWFATAKTLKLFDLAGELAWASPCDPRTLTRAARDHLEKAPGFALVVAKASLHWMAEGHGYELTGADAAQARGIIVSAGKACGQQAETDRWVAELLAGDGPRVRWLAQIMG